ncbi:MAG TPA: bifunctional oligoribonuclease/PAP phosphatase NrnA [Phycisphaerae bacterium]|nr:bifunctional oligoribonuclease/PAP phosphatase NrnA [Phycisphaerae bacterium]
MDTIAETVHREEDHASATKLLISWKCPLLLSHVHPDGDALGCIVGLKAMLASQGRESVAAVYETPSQHQCSLTGVDALHVISGPDDPVFDRVDGVVVMDTCAFAQLTPVADWLDKRHVPRIVLDHHTTRDLPADLHLIDTTASSATLMLYRWAKSAGWDISGQAAKAIFEGLATDTGWFRFSNTTAEALRVAADLTELGVDLDETNQRIYNQDPASLLRFSAMALSGLELHDDDSIALLCVTEQMTKDANVTPDDTGYVVNHPLSVASVRVSGLLVDWGNGVTKCSFRSKGRVDVAKLAASFGGGGHVRAAGARIEAPLEKAKLMVLEHIREQRGTNHA